MTSRNDFNRKLLGYSATAGAALLLAPSSEAQSGNSIVSFQLNSGGFSASPSTLGIGANNFTVATGGGAHFGGDIIVHTRFGGADAAVYFRSAGQGAMAQHGGSSSVDRLVADSHVAAKTAFGGDVNIAHRSTGGANNFPFAPAAGAGQHATGYIGFKTAGNQYGWLKIQVMNNGRGVPTIVNFEQGTDGLYGQIGDSTVVTDGVSAIPEPASVASGLGLLALGAAGVREMRRRRATQSAGGAA